MTQLVVLQVGQRVNQIGCCFLDLALREHAAVNQKGIYYEAISTVLIDVEEGLVNEILQGPLRDVFDIKQLITDISGSGSNWAVGHKCFFIIHSMGGGTGSGLGTFLFFLIFHCVLEDEFPEVYRFMTSIYPSSEKDIITLPHNGILAMKKLNEHADCVKIDLIVNSGKLDTTVEWHKSPFVSMNNIAADLLNLTSSARFEGSLNMDLNEININLVPFLQLNYLVSSLTPLYTLVDVNIPTKRLDQMFSDVFSKGHQLLQADPKDSLYLTRELMVRGNVQILDVRRNTERLNKTLSTVCLLESRRLKTSLCSVPPVGHFYSLALANNTCVKPTFMELKERFMRFYKKKAHLHHCLQVEGIEESCFTEVVLSLSALIQEYNQLDATKNITVQDLPNLSISV
uniref:Tubulin/FtsZ GTPase domain-containing protein n=1 Tax=Aotus nancymaae TaxID=37293 RepID=A0A2K5E4X0_AOTNA